MPPPSTSTSTPNKPFKELPKEKQDIVLYGTKGEQVHMHYHNKDGRQATFDTAFEGVIGNLERRYRETNSEYIREKISEYMSDRPCPTCHGKRLRPEAIAVTVDDTNILQVTEWPVVAFAGMGNPTGRVEIPSHQPPEGHLRPHPEGDRLPPGLPGQRRAGVPDPQPFSRLALRRRSPAHPPGNPGGFAAGGRAVRAG